MEKYNLLQGTIDFIIEKDLKEKIYEKIETVRKQYVVEDFSEPLNDPRVVVCPICGYVASTLRAHLPQHNISMNELKKQFPNFPLYSKNYIYNIKAGITDEGRKAISEKISKRMKNNNPAKRLDVRKKISNTRKLMYKENETFIFKMKECQAKRSSNIVDFEKRLKIPGWGIAGHYRKKIYFRSANELRFLIWCHKNNMLDKVESNIIIKSGTDCYICDFKLNGEYYEIKDKTYAQDEREKKQFRIIDEIRAAGETVHILNKKSDIINSIAFVDILVEYLEGAIQFSNNALNKSLVKQLIKEKNFYETSTTGIN